MLRDWETPGGSAEVELGIPWQGNGPKAVYIGL